MSDLERETSAASSPVGSEQGAAGKSRKTKGEKDKEKKNKAKRTDSGDGTAAVALFALVAAILIFILLTMIQSNVVQNVDKKPVVVAIIDVPEGVLLDESNMAQYFGVEMRPTADLPLGTYENGHDLVNKITSKPILAKEVITPSCLVKEDLFAGVEDPIIIGLEAGRISQAVAGTLRAGDVVDIHVIVKMSDSLLDGIDSSSFDTGKDNALSLEGVEPITGNTPAGVVITNQKEEEKKPDKGVYTPYSRKFNEMDFSEADCIWSPSGTYVSVSLLNNVKVYSVYTSSGVGTDAAETGGQKQVATVVNVIIPRSMASMFELASSDGDIYFSKVINPEPFEVEEAQEESQSVN